MINKRFYLSLNYSLAVNIVRVHTQGTQSGRLQLYLSLLKIVIFPLQIDGFEKILIDSKLRHYPLLSLPASVIGQLFANRRFLMSFMAACDVLCMMGLISYGPEHYNDKSKVPLMSIFLMTTELNSFNFILDFVLRIMHINLACANIFEFSLLYGYLVFIQSDFMLYVELIKNNDNHISREYFKFFIIFSIHIKIH